MADFNNFTFLNKITILKIIYQFGGMLHLKRNDWNAEVISARNINVLVGSSLHVHNARPNNPRLQTGFQQSTTLSNLLTGASDSHAEMITIPRLFQEPYSQLREFSMNCELARSFVWLAFSFGHALLVDKEVCAFVILTLHEVYFAFLCTILGRQWKTRWNAVQMTARNCLCYLRAVRLVPYLFEYR